MQKGRTGNLPRPAQYSAFHYTLAGFETKTIATEVGQFLICSHLFLITNQNLCYDD